MKFGTVTCAVKLVGATSEAERIHFRILNRKSLLPVKSAYVDEETGDTVPTKNQIKGYELDNGEFIHIEPDDIKALKPVAEHGMEVESTSDVDGVDRRYLEKPYFIVPADAVASETFAVIREALRKKNAVARAGVVLYQRGRQVVIQAEDKGMLMTTLRDAGEVLSEKEAFEGLSDTRPDPEMVEIADLLIAKKTGEFDPSDFEDRYETALIKMLEAKKAGRKPPKPVAPPKADNVINLADVLRKSLTKEGIKSASGGKGKGRRKSA